jgi:two-component system catabolic regulation response regulator CreB/two-component system response regulator ChvI
MTKIMVVDDEPDIAMVIQKALQNNGFEVDAFSDPHKAIDGFVPGKYAMLITDIRMPEINGFELYRQIRKVDSKIKVAFMTAFDVYETEFKKVFPNMDIHCFFKKPVRMQEIVERVRRETGEEFTIS